MCKARGEVSVVLQGIVHTLFHTWEEEEAAEEEGGGEYTRRRAQCLLAFAVGTSTSQLETTATTGTEGGTVAGSKSNFLPSGGASTAGNCTLVMFLPPLNMLVPTW